MFGSGVRTGMVPIAVLPKLIPRVQSMVPTACTVVAVLAAVRGIAVSPSEADSCPRRRISTSGYVLPFSSIYENIENIAKEEIHLKQ